LNHSVEIKRPDHLWGLRRWKQMLDREESGLARS
jgi:hypothetical protein